jgi:hypothetical protein
MATLIVKGAIKRIFFNGKGVAIEERYTAKGNETKTRTYTAWFAEAPDLNIGNIVTLSGRHGAVIEAWTNQDGTPKLDFNGKPGQSVVTSLNDTQVVEVHEGSPKAITFDPTEMPF